GFGAHLRRVRRPFAPSRAPCRDGVPELRALPAHARVREHGAAAHDDAPQSVRAAAAAAAAVTAPTRRHGRDLAAGARGGAPAADREPARPATVATLGRPAAAGRAPPRAGARAPRVPAR